MVVWCFFFRVGVIIGFLVKILALLPVCAFSIEIKFADGLGGGFPARIRFHF